MQYNDKYRDYLEQIPGDIKKCVRSGKRHIFGYTSDLDVIVKWNAQTFNNILEGYMVKEPSFTEGEKIGSVEDFAHIISFYAMNGIGGEVEISSIEVCEYLERNFEITFALGGTCAQGAAAFSAVGFPVIAHITDNSNEVCSLINDPHFYLITKDGPTSIKQINSGNMPVRHIIFQYPKGDKIKAYGTEYVIPESNRVIMHFNDKIHKVLPIEKPFLEYCEKNAGQIYSYNVSGFNAIVDPDVLNKRLDELSEHYGKIKKANPEYVLYLESAHYINTECKVKLFNKLSEHMDILGMNEEELVDLTAHTGFVTDKDDLSSVIKGLDFITGYYHIKGIVMHTKDYSMYYGNELKGIDIEKGLTLGNLMSGTRARTGRYGSYNDCMDSLKLDLSPTGMEFARQLSEMSLKKDAHLIPSRYMEYPNCTIGLGDTFTAGMQICFTR